MVHGPKRTLTGVEMKVKNPLLSKFKSKLKANSQEYKPKFQVGDYIINNWQGLKLVCEVVDIKLYSQEIHQLTMVGQPAVPPRKMTREESWGLEVGEYTLLDIVNEHSAVQAKNNAEGVKRIYKRYRDIRKIDSTYTKVDPNVARVLYGKK